MGVSGAVGGLWGVEGDKNQDCREEKRQIQSSGFHLDCPVLHAPVNTYASDVEGKVVTARLICCLA